MKYRYIPDFILMIIIVGLAIKLLIDYSKSGELNKKMLRLIIGLSIAEIFLLLWNLYYR